MYSKKICTTYLAYNNSVSYFLRVIITRVIIFSFLVLCSFSPLLIATYRYIGKNEVADEDDDWGDDGEDTGGIFNTYEDILRSQSISSRSSLRHKM